MRIKGLILRTIPYQESSLICHLLNPKIGRVHGLARGARASKKRFGGGVLEVPHYCDFEVTPGNKPESLWIINEAQIVDEFSHLRSNYDLLQLALEMSKVVDQLAIPEDPSSHLLFNLLGHSLRQTTNRSLIELYRLRFYIKLLSDQGVLKEEPWMRPWMAIKNQNLHEVVNCPEVLPIERRHLLLQVDEYIQSSNPISQTERN